MVWLGPEETEYDPEVRVAAIRFEQSPHHDGEERAGFPPWELARSTRWYRDYKQVVVACRMVVREVTGVSFGVQASDYVDDLFYVPERGAISFGDGQPEVVVDRIDLTLEVTDEVVGYERLRRWKVLHAESVLPWEDG